MGMNDLHNIDEVDDKTLLSIQRTILANTRTFSAWIRTALSSVIAGLAIVKFIGNNEDYKIFVSFIGILFVAIGIGIYIYGYLNYKKSYEKLGQDDHDLSIPLNILLAITIGLVITSLLIMVLIILFN